MISAEITIYPRNNSPIEELPTVRLCPVGPEELAPFWEIPQEVKQFLPRATLNTFATPEKLLADLSAGPRSLVLGIHAGNQALRLVGITFLNDTLLRYPGVGTYILDRDYWNRRVAGMARLGMADFARQHFNSHGVRAKALSVNERAQRSMRWSGCTEVGVNNPRRLQEEIPFGVEVKDGLAHWTHWILFHPDVRLSATPSDVRFISPTAVQSSKERVRLLREKVLNITTSSRVALG